MWFASYVIFLLTDRCMMARLSIWLATTPHQFHWEFHFTWKTKWLVAAWYLYKALKPFWLSNWVRITRVAARFSQASKSMPAATIANLETSYICASPSNQPKLWLIAAPRSRSHFSSTVPSWVPCAWSDDSKFQLDVVEYAITKPLLRISLLWYASARAGQFLE